MALALLALTVAHWGWQWFGPAPVAIPIVAPSGDLSRRIADAGLFGTAATGPANAVQSFTGDLRLLGVFAQRDGTEQILATAHERDFIGDVAMLQGTSALANSRVASPEAFRDARIELTSPVWPKTVEPDTR